MNEITLKLPDFREYLTICPKWEYVFVEPMTLNDNDEYVVCLADQRADHYAIYLYNQQGESHWVADLPTAEQAEVIAHLIRMTATAYCQPTTF